MNFLPDPDLLELWDTWVYIADAGDIHLFYLANKPGGAWGYAGHAVSTDWLHWTDLPEIRLRGDDGAWDGGPCGTGMVFRYDDGRYYMTYTGALSTNEASGLLVSSDLITWEKLTPDRPLWPRMAELPYERGSQRVAQSPAWRDAFVTRNPAGEWEAVCSARVDKGPAACRACLARCRLNGLSDWQTLGPVAHTGRYSSMEVPEIFEFDGRFWVIFSTGSMWGSRLDTGDRLATTGTYYLNSESWDGPYSGPKNNLLLGAGSGRMDGYVARVVEYQGEHLVYHHYAGKPTAMGLPKKLVRHGDGLALAPWNGLTALRMRPIDLYDWRALTFGAAVAGRWSADGPVVQGHCKVGSDAFVSAPIAANVDLQASVTILRGREAGIGVGFTQDARSSGTAFMMDAGNGRITVSQMDRWEHGNGLRTIELLDVVSRKIRRNQAYRLRLLLRHRYVELFLDGLLVFSTVLSTVLPGQSVACVVESASAQFEFHSCHELEPLARA